MIPAMGTLSHDANLRGEKYGTMDDACAAIAGGVRL